MVKVLDETDGLDGLGRLRRLAILLLHERIVAEMLRHLWTAHRTRRLEYARLRVIDS